ncbi:MAG TPA: deoxyguanosinetriphosphate triphosphohydrolase [Abditibacteriaceae bacterium]|nr:deoxyguanosinetriphosphate triphosphohydrolase [Abditibacteriaceae bacterium]
MSTRTPTQHLSSFDGIGLMLQQREDAWLDPRAAKAHLSRGRMKQEADDNLRTQWQRDRDRILHSKAFRRLKHKTQVFVSPEHDHYRTRLTHTLEVAQIARTVARALRLNEDLTEAIGLGHDLGHAPFGHVGEEALDAAYRRFDSGARFRHFEHSLRLVDVLEKNGDGLNLTWETRDGILHHSKGKSDLMIGENHATGTMPDLPATLEGQVMRICDRVAYVNHDIDDATRAGLIRAEDLPSDCIEVLGDTHARRITTMIGAIIQASSEIEYSNGAPVRLVREQIAMNDQVMHATDKLKNWMFEHVYHLKSVDETRRVQCVIGALFERFMDEPELMKNMSVPQNAMQPERARIVCDYIAGMTDRFASQTYLQLFMPSSWRGA